jgi:CubicO group peptidase (beta-lactamase class C family)
LPLARPAAQGISEARLGRLDDFMKGAITSGDYLGAVTLVARGGRIVQWRAYGHRDVAKASVMKPDTIFRIYSMTKPIASVAALVLMEEGKLASLEEPVAHYLPEFAAQPAMTIRHLLTHTAGFGGDKGGAEQSADLKAYSEAVSRMPLEAKPGERFKYDSANTEVLSRLVEVVSGQPFDAFLRSRILAPLRMDDTFFTVPAQKRARIAEMTSSDREGRIVAGPAGDAAQPGDPMRRYLSGAGGLYSTAPDYARFCQMLLDGGELDGVRILGRKSVELMMMNHLTHLDPPVNQYSKAEGFGLGGYVVLDVAGRGRPGSVGQFGWSGAGGTYFAIDRQERLVSILLTQHVPQGLPRDPQKLSSRFYNLVYQSLVK